MILITTALQAEAQPLLTHFKLKHDARFKRIQLYRNNELLLAVTGVCVTKASAVTSAVLSQPDFDIKGVLNIGIAGSAIHKNGSLFRINQIKQASNKACFYPEAEPIKGFQQTGILCVDEPLTDAQQLSERFSLVDMESAGLFTAASLFLDVNQIECLKIVSDKLEGIWLGKEFISELISSQLNEIDAFLNQKNWGNTCNPHDTEIENWLVLLEQNIPITLTQRRSLHNFARFYLLRKTTSGLPEPDFSTYSGKPSERDVIIENLSKRLIN
ncbi:hypothetical protein EP331_06165 [bacterium]|nr:MAG: hypothetical protein EP331_06165 [bacterium]